jgi:hypothetical protein
VKRRSVILIALLVAGVLVVAPMSEDVVSWLRGFLEFYSGVFALLSMTAATVAGVLAAHRAPGARFRILIQGAHRAAAVMTIGFLVAHVLLKVMEAHASVLDVVIPFAGGRDPLFYIGLGTIASDVFILVMATGLLRGRFVARTRPWQWRAVHGLAYATWPLAIMHGLTAGRAPNSWVTWSYVSCVVLVLVLVLVRLPGIVRARRMLRPQGGAGPAPAPEDAAPSVPDEEFWKSLRAEADQWIGERR